MFERFTDRARRAVVLSQEEARRLNHNYIGTEHLLLGLLHEEEGVAAKALKRLDVSIEDARARVEEIIGQGGSSPSGHIPFTPRAKKVLELSLREALQLGHNYVGTEHLLLGLVREGEGVAAQVLAQLGIDLSRVRQEVIQVLSGYVPAVPEEARRIAGDTPAAFRARTEARRLAGDGPVGTHHILGAIVRDPDSLGAKALAVLGVTPDALEAELGRLDPTGTADELPEAAGARQLRVGVVDDGVSVVLADERLRDRLAGLLEGGSNVVRADDPAAVSFPALWRHVVHHLNDVAWRLEREAAGRWRPPEWDRPWDVAAYVVMLGPEGMTSLMEVAEGIVRHQVRAGLRKWLNHHQPANLGAYTYLAVLVRTGEGGEWGYELSLGERPEGTGTQPQYLVAHALLDLTGDAGARGG